MKRILLLVMALVMLVTSIGGCWIVWDEDRGGRGGESERGGEYERGGGHEERH
ncbi:MAG: hypothetical protein ACLP9S_01825 [Syntrophales bacterium]